MQLRTIKWKYGKAINVLLKNVVLCVKSNSNGNKTNDNNVVAE